MKRKSILISALLALSILAPLQLSSTASAESSDVLSKGTLVRPGAGGYAGAVFCPPSTAAAGVTVPTTLGTNPLLLNLRIECIDLAMLEKGRSSYSPYTTNFVGSMASTANVKTTYCPAGSLLSGFRMNANVYIRDIAPICTSYDSGQVSVDANKGFANNESLNSISTCEPSSGKPTYVIGLQGYAGTGVDALGVLCGRTLKSDSKVVFSSEPVLLAQYLPKGLVGGYYFLQATSVNPYVNFSSLTQVGGDGSSNTDVFPFKTSTVTTVDGAHYFRFAVKPKSPNVLVKITQITYSSLSYATGLGSGDTKITGSAANSMFIWADSGKIATIPISPTNDARLFTFGRQDLSVISSIKDETEFKVGFTGATGYQYNDLSSRNGATGMMIYGQLIDNSPATPEEPAVVKTPDSPTNFTFNLTKNVVLISVDIPKDLVGSVDRNNFALVSPELGYPETNKLIAGSVDKGKAYFKFKLEDINLGKEVTFRIATLKDSVESVPLLKIVKIPKLITTTPTPKATATPKSTPKVTVPKPKTVRCAKAGVTRRFTGTSCPPGYTKN